MAVYKNMADFEKKLKRWEKQYPDDMVKAMGIASETVRTEVLTKHLTGRKMAKGVGSDSHATLGIVTGRLRASISEKIYKTTTGIKAYVGTFISPTKYAKYHEYGTVYHPKRPFLAPSLQKKRKKIIEILQDAMKRSYDNA